ncbi:MAG: SH3 domain-containing protein, partial [Lachnospiraceae bacterium]|nr:SH3 domain-containing protein [Lachnospiraceae bacterium]
MKSTWNIRMFVNRKSGFIIACLLGCLFVQSFGSMSRIVAAEVSEEGFAHDHPILALVYLCTEYAVRSQASEAAESVVTVRSGQQVQIQGQVADDRGVLWTKVTLTVENQGYEGYIQRSNLACFDETFLAWEKEHQSIVPSNRRSLMRLAPSYPDIEQFPESYQEALLELKEAHPNWIFVAHQVGLDFQTVVENEIALNRSLVPNSYASYEKAGASNESNWSQATEGILRYYLDPRNSIKEETIFQFELLTYNETYHTEAAVEVFLNSTFMSGMMPGAEQTYANAFFTIGGSIHVSPFHLASRVFQEQGAGNSPLISGERTATWVEEYFQNNSGFVKNPSYMGTEPLYNYFNIGATGQGDEAVIANGILRAYQSGWITPALSIEGGGRFISQNYILRGQDTLYLQKFDVDNSDGSLYYHQYMQNIIAPTSEGK